MKIDPPKLPDNTRRKPMQVISSKTPTSTTTSQETSASLAAAGKTRVQISRKFGEGATAYDVVEEQRIISEVFCALNPTEAIFIETCSDGRFFLANDRISPDTKMEGIILEHKLDAQGTEVLTIINYSDRHIKIANVIPISPYNSFETGWYVTSPSLFDSSEIHWGQNFEHCFNIPFISSKTPLPAATLILMRKRHLESNDPRFLKIKVPDLTNAQILALVKEYGSISDTYGGIPCAYESDPAALDSIQHECITPMFPGECESVRIDGKRIFKIYNGKPPVYDRGFDAPVFESGFITHKESTWGYLIQPEVDMTATIQELSDFEDYLNSLGYEFTDPSLGQVGFYDNALTKKREIVLIDPRSVRQSANPIKRVFV